MYFKYDLEDEDDCEELLGLYTEARAHVDRVYPRNSEQPGYISRRLIERGWFERWIAAHHFMEALEKEVED